VNDELQQASRRLSGLTQRRPGLALGLWGEPGIGKTHAALSLLRAFPGRSWTVHATQTLSSVASMLPRPRKPTLWLERSLERLARGEQAEAAVGAQTLAALLSAAAPMLLHVEDLHEASEEGLAFWTQVAGIVNRTRSVGLIVTGRAAPPEGFEALRLSPLNREASDALLGAEVGAALPGEALAWVFERARGNPLFTLEFFRYLSRQGFAWNDGHRWRWRVPEREVMPSTVEAVIEQQLFKVSGTDSVRRTLEVQAFLPLGSSVAVLAAVAELTEAELEAAQQLLAQQGIFVGTEFAHPLFREVQLANLRPERRRDLARLALGILEHDPLQAAAFVEAAALGDAQTVAVLTQAAAQARETANPSLEGRLLARAARFASGEEQYRLALDAAQVLKRIDFTIATQMGELALSFKPHDPEVIELLGHIFALQKRRDRLESILSQLPEEEQGHNGLLRWVRLYSALGDYAAVVTVVEQNPFLMDGDPDTVHDIAWSFLALDRPGEVRALLTKTLSRDDLTETRRARFNYLNATLLSHEGDDHAAEPFFYEALLAYQRLGNSVNLIASLHAHALVLQKIGRYQEVLPKLEDAAQRCLQLGSLKMLAQTHLAIADQLQWFGNYERAEHLYNESLEILRGLQDTDFLLDGLRSMTELYGAWNVPYGAALAFKYASEALESGRATGSPLTMTEVLSANVRASLLNRQPAQAVAFAEEALNLASSLGLPDQMRNVHHLMALALDASGRRDEALEHTREALRWAAKTDDPYAARKVGLELARLTGDLALAREHLGWFEERGLMSGVHLAQRYFPELAGDAFDSPQPESLLRLEVLGSMQLRREGVSTPLRGGKRKELLALLLEARIRGRSEVAALDLCDALYPLEPEEAALGALRAAVFKIRSSLGAALVTTTPNGYALGLVASDAEAFLHSGDTNLWRGLYLEDLTLEGRDENVCDALNKALRTRIEALLEADIPTNLGEAVRLSHLLVRAEPYDLGTLAVACRVLQASRNRKALDRLYSEARTRMLEVGEALPEGSAAFLEMHAVTEGAWGSVQVSQ
jgi:tetratricopeptide (TPR) repeat protein